MAPHRLVLITNIVKLNFRVSFAVKLLFIALYALYVSELKKKRKIVVFFLRTVEPKIKYIIYKINDIMTFLTVNNINNIVT